MGRWLILILALLTTATACAEDMTQGTVGWEGLSLNIENCRVEAWQEETGVEGYSQTTLCFDWQIGNLESEEYLFDVSDIAHPGTTPRTWEPGYDLTPYDPNLTMGVIPVLGEYWIINETASLNFRHETDRLEMPLEVAFQVDFYRPVVKTSHLDLVNQRWRMVSVSDRILAAQPDLPHLNGGSNTPRVLMDYFNNVAEGESFKARLDYQRDRAALRRLVAEMYVLADHMITYEVHIIFDAVDRPGRVVIAERP